MKQFIDIVNAYCSNVSLFILTALVISFVLAIIHKRYKYLTGVLFIMTAWIGILTMPQGKDRLGGIQMPEKTLPLVA